MTRNPSVEDLLRARGEAIHKIVEAHDTDDFMNRLWARIRAQKPTPSSPSEAG
ncbi:hypothetical protein ACIOEX_21635 [Streptomyces sp. NPDC087850]|uniref:hypothetical protein n=1 Tax=Streptomyces sp. NPDC087850 TaxID=3365809 RepID=UPI0037F6608E